MILPVLTASLLGYLLGSIPFGMVLTRIAGYGDIRSIGSGNIGATNVLRTGSKKLAILTLLLDGAKGATAIFLISLLFPAPYFLLYITGFCALLGHMFPLWLKFKGGKGVATALGVLLVLSWPVGLAALATWLATAAFSRISSLAALVAVSLSPTFAFFLGNDQNLPLFCALTAMLIIVKHRSNIARLRRGEEPKIGQKKKEAA